MDQDGDLTVIKAKKETEAVEMGKLPRCLSSLFDYQTVLS